MKIKPTSSLMHSADTILIKCNCTQLLNQIIQLTN